MVCELGRCPVHDVKAGVETAAAAVSCCVASKSSHPIVDPVKTLQIVLVCRKYEKSFNSYILRTGFLIIVVPRSPSVVCLEEIKETESSDTDRAQDTVNLLILSKV